ncbi:CdaR family transcriptional regulator [Streptomyces yaizuensis]|uniref:Helix-turn-helix domain-containing protein n=1 Tax=Streptomyces yaizuensis TaxID=2989713 RepID=A0ABQ5P1F3_9ACTN|nr:sugar diacid recognition domain-containing protein [Streptomyces sp. YSPA8]GLF96036.1 helix-turn-helix domain-containing protein [Streptomyces sp. YSPA8]
MFADAVAQSIVDDVVTRLGVSVNIMDEHGVIVASSDRSRLGTVHEGALRVLRTGTPLALSQDAARTLGGTRAGVNLPLWVDGRVVGVVGVRGEPGEVGEIARAVARLAELMVMRETFAGETGWRHQVRRQVVRDLLAGRLTEEGWRQGQQLGGCRVDPPYTLFAVRGGTPAPMGEPRELYRLLEADERSALIAPDSTGIVWTVTGGSDSVALRHRLARLCETDPGAGVLDAGPADDFPALLERAGQARLAVRRRLAGQVRLADLELPVLLARLDRETRVTAAERVLGPLSAELRRTLGVYFAHNCGAAESADLLRIHRNTLAYRLGRVTELTGKDPRVFQDAVALQVALHLCDIDDPADSPA